LLIFNTKSPSPPALLNSIVFEIHGIVFYMYAYVCESWSIIIATMIE